MVAGVQQLGGVLVEVVEIASGFLQYLLHQRIAGDVSVEPEQVDDALDVVHVKYGIGEAVEPFFHQVGVPEVVPEVDKLHVVLKVVLPFGLIYAERQQLGDASAQSLRVLAVAPLEDEVELIDHIVDLYLALLEALFHQAL